MSSSNRKSLIMSAADNKTPISKIEPNTYTLYWLDGVREVIRGDDIAQAFVNAGYGDGSLRAVDMWRWGNDTEYVWDKAKRVWVRDINSLVGAD